MMDVLQFTRLELWIQKHVGVIKKTKKTILCTSLSPGASDMSLSVG